MICYHRTMCCFTEPVEDVSLTRIFARCFDSRQVLVYEMTLAAPTPLAMVLPLPIAAGSGEGAVEFVSLEDYPGFFDDMESGFPEPVAAGVEDFAAAALEAPAAVLAVHRVGAFEASFVPSTRDFERLDPRFRLPENIWAKLPGYKDYGFAVFKLQEGDQRVHPMAFLFPTRHPGTLFFPTVHIHDGDFHESADFDHALYAQRESGLSWRESAGPAAGFMKLGQGGAGKDLARGLVRPDLPCYKRSLSGGYENRDVFSPGRELEVRPMERRPRGGSRRAGAADAVNMVRAMLSKAALEGASEIRIEPVETGVRLKVLAGERLEPWTSPPKRFHLAIISRLKILANLNIAERRKPQQGAFNMELGDKTWSCRVSFTPSPLGETTVIRLEKA